MPRFHQSIDCETGVVSMTQYTTAEEIEADVQAVKDQAAQAAQAATMDAHAEALTELTLFLTNNPSVVEAMLALVNKEN